MNKWLQRVELIVLLFLIGVFIWFVLTIGAYELPERYSDKWKYH